mmetsp:Transcript_15174/g.29486  ORF Transcript_15174/g.29486 Transcript_15174/m.29486 type:complete len:128 (-) Transcript_15174:203-586(-)
MHIFVTVGGLTVSIRASPRLIDKTPTAKNHLRSTVEPIELKVNLPRVIRMPTSSQTSRSSETPHLGTSSKPKSGRGLCSQETPSASTAGLGVDESKAGDEGPGVAESDGIGESATWLFPEKAATPLR